MSQSHLEKLKNLIATALWKRDLYTQVFSGPDGEKVLNDILRYAGVGADPFVPGRDGTTEYNAGKQAVAARIIQIMNMSEVDVRRRILEQQSSIQPNLEDASYE